MVLGFGRKDRAKLMLANALGGAEPPSLPSLTLKILSRLRDPEVEFDEVAQALSWDPGLSVKVLATVNSAAFAPTQPILDVRQALAYLGRSALEQLILAVAVRGALPSDPAPGFDVERFWYTAAQRAALGRALAEQLHPARAGEAFTAALLLDLAVPVMSHRLGAKYGDALLEWHGSPDVELDDVERGRIGVTHTRVGSLLAECWELPNSLSRAIAQHHDSSVGQDDLLPAVRLIGRAREVDPQRAEEDLIEVAQSEYGLSPDWTRDAIVTSNEAAVELSRSLAS